jgi:deoxycytidylate deaminase
MLPNLTPDTFAALIPSLCDRETGADPEGWTPENPLWTHCVVVSMLAQDLFGGTLLRGSLLGTAFAAMRSHYWNLLPEGERDFTAVQFGEEYPTNLETKTIDRSHMLSHPATVARYQELGLRLGRALSENHPLFDDERYQACYKAALLSPCQKMRFGATLVHDGGAVITDSNRTITPLASFCQTSCIRLGITSRTESMIGSCGHAEEWVLWEAVRRGLPLGQCDLYIAGLRPTSHPWIKDKPVHTCLRCSTQMWYAGLRRIYVPVQAGWAGITTEEAILTAKDYALGVQKA